MASSIGSLAKCVSPVLVEGNVGTAWSASVSSSFALGAPKAKSVKLVSGGTAFKVQAAAAAGSGGSDSQEAVRQFALRGFQTKRALKVGSRRWELSLTVGFFVWYQLKRGFGWIVCDFGLGDFYRDG